MRHPISGRTSLIVTCLHCEWWTEEPDMDTAVQRMDEHSQGGSERSDQHGA